MSTPRSSVVLRLSSFAYRLVVLPLALLLLSSCGGGGGGDATGPAKVATVQVTAPSATLEVGALMLVSVRYLDSKGTQLSGKSVTFVSSNSLVATVDNSGNVTGVAPGSASIRATVDGVTGGVDITVVPVPVSAIVISPANPAVRQGETLALTAQPIDAVGRPLAGRTVTWSTANAAIATVNATSGLVTGVAAGSAYIRAESEGKRDSTILRVKGLNAPAITGSSPTLLTAGGTGTLSGTNFGPSPNDNEVFVNGVRGTVTAATATSVSFTVPAALALPCTPTGPAKILLVANGDSANTTMSLRMAVQRTLSVGQSVLFTSQGDLFCNEFAATGGRYLVTAFNYLPSGGIKTSFEFLGASTATTLAQGAASAQAPAPLPSAQGLGASLVDDPAARHLRAHLVLQQRERAFAKLYGNPRLAERMRRNGAGLDVAVVNPPPQVGDMATYRMMRTLSSYVLFDEVRFRAVYVGSKIIIYEDSLAPLARSMDNEYQRMGQEFDQVTWPILLNFGNPLVVDSALDNNGHLIALFSPRVNNYKINGVSNQILGFVTLCDYFPRAQQVVNGVTIPACPSSNEAEAFYAIVPDNGASGGLSINTWRRYMRGTLAHESKHITSYAERYYRDAEEIEDTWLEEATAQQASEMWARSIYNRTQLADVRWLEGPLCDYAPISTTCPDPAEGILHHFSFLYDHYNALESKSILDNPDGPIDPVIYGSSWSFARWVTDVFGTNEGTFLRSLVQVKNDHGTDNIASKSGHPFSELLGLWSLASLADNYPGATINDSRLRLPSWNSRDLFAEMSRNITSGGAPAFPRPWPLNVRSINFGNFPSGVAQVNLLPGGGFAAWDVSGTQSAPQVLAIRDPTGALPPPGIGLAIVRVQ